MMRVTAHRRSLISIVGSRFGEDPDGEAAPTAFPDLSFAGPLARRLAERLAPFGYADPVDLVDLPAAALGREVADRLATLGSDDIAVVHVIGHGTVHDRTKKLLVVGADGTAGTEVERWLTDVEGRDGDGGPWVLFLVDLCHAGAAARLDWQTGVADESRRAWVIAATGQHDPAYGGRFTTAVCTVLERISAGGFDISPADPHVPPEKVAREIRREVDRLSADSYGQRVLSIRTDLASWPYFPFVPNPAYAGGNPSQLASAHLDVMTRPFLDDIDEALDWLHFASRAGGSGTAGAAGGVDLLRPGAFRGRHRELQRLADILDQPAPAPCLALVTGSPGAGKSALLGITVCAAHPVLSEVTEPLWRDHRDRLPAVHEGIAAVHCRQRHLYEIVASISRQIDVPLTTVEPGVLVAALQETRTYPAIVLDALDEAMDPQNVMSALILPLALVSRLIVGVRPWAEFETLRERAAAAGLLVDLDAVPQEELRGDLAAYIDDILRPRYGTVALRGIRRTVAASVAEILAEPPAPEADPPTPQGEPEARPETFAEHSPSGVGERHVEDRWGAFLVAGLFAHHLAGRPVVTDPGAAATLAAAVPRTLPDVFELELAELVTRSPWRRAVLTALAYSYGAGLPRRLIAAALTVLVPPDADAAPPAEEEVTAALDDTRFYLRREPDVDRTTLYRLFHQGLADHLRGRDPHRDAARARAIHRAFLAELGEPARWSLAEPYLLRNAPNHAAAAGALDDLLTDSGFLSFGEPQALNTVLAQTSGGVAARNAAVYRRSFAEHAGLAVEGRRSILIIDAHRLGAADLAADLAAVVDLPPPGWRVRWATDRPPHVPVRSAHDVTASNGPSDRPVVALTHSDGVSIFDPAADVVIPTPARPPGRVLAVHRKRDDVHLCYRYGSEIQLIGVDVTDPHPRQSTVDTLDGSGGSGRASAAFTAWNGRIVLLVATDRLITAWDVETVEPLLQVPADRVVTLKTDMLGGTPVLLAVASHAIDILELPSGKRLYSITRPRGSFRAAGLTSVGGEPAVVIGDEDGQLGIWRLHDGQLLHQEAPVVHHQAKYFSRLPAVTAVTAVPARTDLVDPVVCWGDRFGVVHRWSASMGQATRRGAFLGHTVSVLTPYQDALLAGSTRHLALIDPVDGSTLDDMLRVEQLVEPPTHPLSVAAGRQHTAAIRAIALDGSAGRFVTVAGDRTARLWSIDDGTTTALEAGHSDWVNAVTVAGTAGRRLALTGSTDSTARLWDLDGGAELRVFRGHRGWIRGVVLDASMAAAAADDGVVLGWHPETGEPITRIDAGTSLTCLTAAGPDDDRLLFAGGTDGVTRCWRAATGELLRTYPGPADRIWTVVVSDLDGEMRLYAAGEDGRVWAWRAGDGAPLGSFTGIRSRVTTMSVAGPLLAAGADDGTVRVWDLRSGVHRAEVTFPGKIGGVALTTDGRLAVGFDTDVAVVELTDA